MANEMFIGASLSLDGALPVLNCSTVYSVRLIIEFFFFTCRCNVA